MNTNICNKCGQEHKYTTDITVNLNYGSSFDGQTWIMHLCDDCLEGFAKECFHEPEGYGKTGFEDYWNVLQEAYS